MQALIYWAAQPTHGNEAPKGQGTVVAADEWWPKQGGKWGRVQQLGLKLANASHASEVCNDASYDGRAFQIEGKNPGPSADIEIINPDFSMGFATSLKLGV